MNKIDDLLVLLSPKETARRLSISPTALRWQIDHGKFPAPRWIGGQMRFLASDVVAYANHLPIAEIDRRGFPEEEKPKRDTPEKKRQRPAEALKEVNAHEPERRRLQEEDRKRAAAQRTEEANLDAHYERNRNRNRDPKAPLPLP